MTPNQNTKIEGGDLVLYMYTLNHDTLSHLKNDRDVSAYSGGRRLSSHTQLVCFLTHSKRNTEIDA